MAIKALFHCNNCGHEFTTSEGAGWHFTFLRCADCDSIRSVDTEGGKIKGGSFKCHKCGGEMKEGLKPMCRKCKSRDTIEKEVEIYSD
jgi:Zn finger protein HypA/HybF involved in hydrogenase expression